MKLNNNGFIIKPQALATSASTSNTQTAVANPSKPASKNVQLPAYAPVVVPSAKAYNQAVKQASVLDNFSPQLFARFRTDKTQTVQATQAVKQVQPTTTIPYKNNLKTLFQNNQAVIYAMIPRTFNAKNNNSTDLIDAGDESGTFLNAIERLDEMKAMGINTFHILPIHPPGEIEKKGDAGSVYAPDDYLKIDPILDDKNDPRSVNEEMKVFTNECHKRGIKVMLDLPSCMSVDFYNRRPDLRAEDALGNPETPQGWEDIRMFEPWADEDKRILNPALVDMHKKYVDMCIDLGVDGIRADVGRAKPVEFWDVIIPYARSKDPEFAFLAETYTYEDASPMLNMPKDRPKDLLKAGFDSYYGQYHIFHGWNARDFHDFIEQNLEMSYELDKGKSLIGSFATHDDPSPMSNGNEEYCMMTNVVQATVPMTNPYMVTGFESGDRYIYNHPDITLADGRKKYYTHEEFVDIFNLSRKPGGDHPEIGQHFGKLMNETRKAYEDVITKGSYIELDVKGSKNDDVIAYARHLNGKTLLVVVNKDVNAREKVKVKVPGLKSTQQLKDIAPSYGMQSAYKANNSSMTLDLGPARAHIFEIDTPNIEHLCDPNKVFKQNL